MRAVSCGIFALLWAYCAMHAVAQSYPSRPVRAIIPAGAGTPTDIVGRAIGQAIVAHLGQTIVIENRVGANGIIGMEACARAAPDGYTLCMVANAQIGFNPALYLKLPYDPVRDYAPIVLTGITHNGLAVHAGLAFNSLKELLDHARARPGALNWASWGVGSPSHLSLAWLEARSGASFTHVLYKEPSMAFLAVQTGESQVITNPTGVLAPQVKAGKLKALAVGGTARSPYLPNVPTFAEQGFDFTYRGWNGAIAPAAISPEQVRRLNAAFNAVLADKDFTARFMAPIGVEPAGGTPEEFAAFIRSEIALSRELVQIAKLKPQ